MQVLERGGWRFPPSFKNGGTHRQIIMDKPWKKEERIIAKAFSSSRSLMKGTAEKGDVKSELFLIDAKVRQRWKIHNWFSALKKIASLKIPILIVRKPKEKLRLAVIEFDFLISLLKAADLIPEEQNNGEGSQ